MNNTNKVCVDLIVPGIEERYNVLIPINKKTLEVIYLLNKAINEMTDGSFVMSEHLSLINADSGMVYDLDKNFFINQGIKIVGVAVNVPTEIWGQKSVESLVKAHSGMITDSLDNEFKIHLNNSQILLKIDNENVFRPLLETLYQEYSICVYNLPGAFYIMQEFCAELIMIFVCMLIICFIIAILMLTNLIAFGVSIRSKEIGVLKALGMQDGQIKKVYLLETVILGVIAFIIAIIGVRVFYRFANLNIYPYYGAGLTNLEIKYFYFTPMTFILMGLVTFGIMPLFTLLPLIAITKLNPVDAIKK